MPTMRADRRFLVPMRKIELDSLYFREDIWNLENTKKMHCLKCIMDVFCAVALVQESH